MPGPLIPLGTQSKLAVTNGAVITLTLPTAQGMFPSHMIINVQTGDVRYTTDGTTPVTGAAGTGIGIVALAGSTISFMDANFDYRTMIRGFKVIASTATAATLDIAYFSSWASV